MKTLSLKISAALAARLERAAKQRKESKSSLVRAALEQFFDGPSVSSIKRPVSVLDLAGDLVGCVEGPGDLSTNPKYMEDFGK